MIEEFFLREQYVELRRSVSEIAESLHCSQNKINYWLSKHKIKKRSISEAVYLKSNPSGNPFIFKHPCSPKEWFLYGMGLGLYWGEGNKANTQSVRLGNTDPDLILFFLDFLKCIYSIDESRLRFGIQIFSDCDPAVAKSYWKKKLNVHDTQFQKVVVTPTRARGTYTKKTKYGVLTIYFSNTKLRDMICASIDELRK